MKKIGLCLLLIFSVNAFGGDVRSIEIVRVFNELRADNLQILDSFYHPEVKFQDPVGKIEGRENIKAYYKKMYKSVKEITFEFTSEVNNGDEYMMAWTMRLKTDKLKGGEEIKVDGVSHIAFAPGSNLVIRHRDYFDMGEFLYENIPVFGSVVKYFKEKLE